MTDRATRRQWTSKSQLNPSKFHTRSTLGIDVATALKRTGGNRKRYESLLRRFADPQSNAPDNIRAALAANDFPTVRLTR